MNLHPTESGPAAWLKGLVLASWKVLYQHWTIQHQTHNISNKDIASTEYSNNLTLGVLLVDSEWRRLASCCRTKARRYDVVINHKLNRAATRRKMAIPSWSALNVMMVVVGFDCEYMWKIVNCERVESIVCWRAWMSSHFHSSLCQHIFAKGRGRGGQSSS